MQQQLMQQQQQEQQLAAMYSGYQVPQGYANMPYNPKQGAGQHMEPGPHHVL